LKSYIVEGRRERDLLRNRVDADLLKSLCGNQRFDLGRILENMFCTFGLRRIRGGLLPACRPKGYDKILSQSRPANRPSSVAKPMIAFGYRAMRVSSSTAERPMCPACKHWMGLARISPGKRGFEQRTFECSTCHGLETVSFPVDPMKTDALGWLAGDLKPPR
jgi:hypothetical protein